MNIEKLWESACSGDIKVLKEYYEKECGAKNIRYEKFGTQHSLIMGAFRNEQYETVEYLLSVGENITFNEKEYVLKKLERNEILKKLGGI